MAADALRRAALAVLARNDLGDWTKPAPRLYPHQWSWDSAFVAIGLAPVNLDRALRELETLFSAQWSDGRVPHIVFNPEAHDYFPGPEWWASASTNAAAPRDRATSGLVQPPVHAIAAQRILYLAIDQKADAIVERVRALYPRLLAWHRYLASARDPLASGLLVIYHPWESRPAHRSVRRVLRALHRRAARLTRAVLDRRSGAGLALRRSLKPRRTRPWPSVAAAPGAWGRDCSTICGG